MKMVGGDVRAGDCAGTIAVGGIFVGAALQSRQAGSSARVEEHRICKLNPG